VYLADEIEIGESACLAGFVFSARYWRVRPFGICAVAQLVSFIGHL